MKLTLTTLLLIGLVATVCAEDMLKTRACLTNSGVTYSWIISKDNISSIPDWLPGSGEPPLSISKAIVIARDCLNSPNQMFLSITLKRISNKEPTKWMYVFDYEYSSKESNLFPVGHIAVLLNGNAVEPTVEANK